MLAFSHHTELYRFQVLFPLKERFTLVLKTEYFHKMFFLKLHKKWSYKKT